LEMGLWFKAFFETNGCSTSNGTMFNSKYRNGI
jgi:hypothetical protein